MKKKAKRPAHIWPLYTLTVNQHKWHAFVTEYAKDRRGYRIFDGQKLIEEVGGIYSSSQGSPAQREIFPDLIRTFSEHL